MSIKQLIKSGAGWLYLHSPSGQRTLRGAGTILMLHRVLADERAAALPHRRALCIGVHSFEQLLHWLGAHFDCLPLHELLDPPRPRSGKPALALTFDDGWADNASQAFPLLLRQRIPASIFLSTDFIGTPRPFWWEAIGETLWGQFGAAPRAALAAALGELGQAPPAALFGQHPEQARSQALAHYLQQLKGLPASTLQALAERCPPAPSPHAMDWQQVRQLEDSGLVRFGPHGASHAILSRLDEACLHDELQRSHAALAAHCRAPLPVYCYPNGDHDARVRAAVERLGYHLALSTRPGLHGGQGNPLALPRIGVCQASARQPALLGWRILQSLRQPPGAARRLPG